jgi:hypothetical protein
MDILDQLKLKVQEADEKFSLFTKDDHILILISDNKSCLQLCRIMQHEAKRVGFTIGAVCFQCPHSQLLPRTLNPFFKQLKIEYFIETCDKDCRLSKDFFCN